MEIAILSIHIMEFPTEYETIHNGKYHLEIAIASQLATKDRLLLLTMFKWGGIFGRI